MVEQIRNCILCGLGGDVKLLAIERYNKYLSILNVRKIKEVKYFDMKLPPYTGNDFYPKEWYKKFSSIPKSLLLTETEIDPKTN